ncbi:NAD(P)/FAD-dependent oxidoreductase [Dyadobacter aurulentus]|uniref:NAD(P)/FAD-dependent oxidoreductase n=1 Tax=Dyadobacter sp. UC 10 TaxID=2605428 RepID=UPI0011F1B344|nr:NAD(P)/FAD-dependent oxidoreductase [Dyadobacter sp. UC 10]KAA0993643.1 NAD(P)/FAD-dependent oxidoreductase [Dyadobacter sp. UC 10]
MIQENDFDVVIVGGSYAGLSAAMALGRSLWKVAVIDSGKPCNAQTPHSHNFITHDGDTPAAIAAAAKEQVLAYPTVQFIEDLVTGVSGEDNQFEVFTEKGLQLNVKKVLFATGVKDLMPDLPGHAECWGISVIHCPFCHGYEYHDEETGIITNGEMTLDFAKLIRNWTPKLTIFTNGPAVFGDQVKDSLEELGVSLNERTIEKIEHRNGYVSQLVFTDHTTQHLKALYSRPPFVQHCRIPEQLGCTLTEQGHISVDTTQRTSVAGIFAAGDNTTMARSVSGSIAAGGMAGARICHDLISQQYS